MILGVLSDEISLFFVTNTGKTKPSNLMHLTRDYRSPHLSEVFCLHGLLVAAVYIFHFISILVFVCVCVCVCEFGPNLESSWH